TIPANHNAVDVHSSLMDERHEDHRTTGFEQYAFVDHLVRHRLLSLWLTDDDQIEASANTADLVGSARNTRIYDARFCRNSHAFNRLLEAGNSRACLLVRFSALGFDDFRRNAAHHSAGNDGFVGDRNAEQVGIEGFCYRSRILAGRIARTESQIHDNVFDHDVNLLAARKRPALS